MKAIGHERTNFPVLAHTLPPSTSVLAHHHGRGLGSLTCAGCRYTDSSACMMRRGSPLWNNSSLNVHALDGCAGITQVRVATARRPSFQHLMV